MGQILNKTSIGPSRATIKPARRSVRRGMGPASEGSVLEFRHYVTPGCFMSRAVRLCRGSRHRPGRGKSRRPRPHHRARVHDRLPHRGPGRGNGRGESHRGLHAPIQSGTPCRGGRCFTRAVGHSRRSYLARHLRSDGSLYTSARCRPRTGRLSFDAANGWTRRQSGWLRSGR